MLKIVFLSCLYSMAFFEEPTYLIWGLSFKILIIVLIDLPIIVDISFLIILGLPLINWIILSCTSSFWGSFWASFWGSNPSVDIASIISCSDLLILFTLSFTLPPWQKPVLSNGIAASYINYFDFCFTKSNEHNITSKANISIKYQAFSKQKPLSNINW